ncbi:YlbF family regulator [Megasphaera hutchinsoni]|uniref:Uncharacterized protein n=1 Tax=Megasphaera hutchinsoni TaxID=1588748 RepID=A0A134CKL4_9FIRM|nr:YlbF family regulator [Megasphaera hutchinsoni]KXB92762.1 hypothetical protein HMPREF3182_00230 [Megasphaera hutchinsoni]MUP48277.1 YlbF family regulator [Veillonellaceae bacterium M2-8]MUP59440.1 YlbF family regulator [Veillonellaceae bacterium M2-4]
MKLYDQANVLAKAIKECKEYQDVIEAGKELKKDEKTKQMVKEFLILQAELAYAQSMGGKEDKQKVDRLNDMSVLIKNNAQAQSYLQKYRAWQTIAGEVFQIIQNAMAEGMSILDK